MPSLKEESSTFIIDHVPKEKLIADRGASSELMDRENRKELSFHEIALIMDISHQSAKNLMQKTLQKLKEKVANRS